MRYRQQLREGVAQRAASNATGSQKSHARKQPWQESDPGRD